MARAIIGTPTLGDGPLGYPSLCYLLILGGAQAHIGSGRRMPGILYSGRPQGPRGARFCVLKGLSRRTAAGANAAGPRPGSHPQMRSKTAPTLPVYISIMKTYFVRTDG